MTQTKTQRGPLLSSVVMVMLATAATGLLAVIGFQALPESVVQSTFGSDNHETRNVDVSESPSVKPSVKPTTAPPTPTSVPSTTVPQRSTRAPQVVRPSSNPARPVSTKTATSTATTPPPPKKTTTPKPSPSPTATQTTQAPSPAPTCGTGRKPRCPRQPSPAASPSSSGFATTSSYEPPTNSSTQAGQPAKPHHKHARHHRS